MPVDIDKLEQDPGYQRLSFPDKVLTLEKSGLTPEDATTRALAMQKRLAAESRSMMDQPRGANRMLKTVGQYGMMAAPSIAGEVAGEVAAPFLGYPRELGGGVGAMAGEGLAQLFGITPVSLEQLMLAGAVGFASPPTAQAARVRGLVRGGTMTPTLKQRLAVAKRVPGSGGAIQEMAREAAESIPGRIRQEADIFGQTPSQLWSGALAETAIPEPVMLKNTSQAAAVLARGQSRAQELGLTGGKKLLKDTEALAQLASRRGPHGGKLNVLDVDLIRRDLEGKMGAIRNKTRLKQYRRLLRGVFLDIDEAVAAGNQQAALLQDATALSRRNFAADDIQEFLDRTGIISAPQQGTGAVSIRVNRIQDAIRRAREGKRPPAEFRLLKGSIPDSELKEIEDLLSFWNEASVAIPPPSGVQFGSGPTVIASMTAGGIATALAGKEVGMGVAAATAGSRWLIARTLASPKGRTILRAVIERGQPVDFVEIAGQVIAQTGRQSFGANPSMMVQEAIGQEQLSAPR